MIGDIDRIWTARRCDASHLCEPEHLDGIPPLSLAGVLSTRPPTAKILVDALPCSNTNVEAGPCLAVTKLSMRHDVASLLAATDLEPVSCSHQGNTKTHTRGSVRESLNPPR